MTSCDYIMNRQSLLITKKSIFLIVLNFATTIHSNGNEETTTEAPKPKLDIKRINFNRFTPAQFMAFQEGKLKPSDISYSELIAAGFDGKFLEAHGWKKDGFVDKTTEDPFCSPAMCADVCEDNDMEGGICVTHGCQCSKPDPNVQKYLAEMFAPHKNLPKPPPGFVVITERPITLAEQRKQLEDELKEELKQSG